MPIVPGLYFSWSTAEGVTSLDLSADKGLLFRAQAHVAKPPQWFSFNVTLGKAAFAPGDVLGVVADLEGCEGDSLPLVVRSARDGETRGTLLQDRLSGSGDRAVQTALHTVDGGDFLAGAPAFHTLAMQLPKHDFTLALRDLRLFVIPAARGLRSQAPTLSSFSA